MKIGMIGCLHETNTFSPNKTELDDFLNQEWILGEGSINEKYQGSNSSVAGVIDSAEREGFQLVPLLYTRATPSGIVSNVAMEKIQSTICDELREVVNSLDGLILIFHGAMVSEKIDDVEGELLQCVRSIVGTKPIAMTLDLHANVTEKMVSHSDIIIGYDTYPHIDMYERATEACNQLVSLIRKEIQPVHSFKRANLLVAPPSMDTNMDPMKKLMEMAFNYEQDEEVLNVSILGGFPYSDVPFASMSVIVTTNNNREKGDRIVKELITWVWSHKERFEINPIPIDKALIQVNEVKPNLTILVESSDNVGGGSPADATHALNALVSSRQEYFLIYICDKEAVESALSIGINGSFSFMVGGKTDKKYDHSPIHGESVEIKGRVKLLSDGLFIHRGEHSTNIKGKMGRVAVIELENCLNSIVVLTERRVSLRDIDQIESIGLHLDDFKIIVVKAAIAWKTAFKDVEKYVIEIDSPGCCSSNLEHFKYKKLSNQTHITGT
ncbi:M81 family metallopeptidase [Ornithinibacillus sp. 4-3]|uniref:M81 family metallopeptidase n=1 Tax=Ornithinibacillus sp. 4-3 TaxID=3231488 RepID=A0AB39HMM7_9BACI